MSATQNAVENLDLQKLNDQDKAEIRQFLENQQQRSSIQSRECKFLGCCLLLSSSCHWQE
jgi:mitochondrial import inner membrane translocase subunit TIM8